jgi:hypothetical protein
MAYKKKKETVLISEFDKYKKICQLRKSHSPITILFCTKDLPDEWLIDVVEYKTRSGVVVDSYYITSKEMPGYIDFCGRAGHTILTKF